VAAKFLETDQQAKRRANVITIAAEAADQIEDNATEDPVDPDWIARFFSHAQDISNSDLQRLWGHLLAREVERPGRVPLRTLDLLRNITKTEAALFQRFAACVSTNCLYLPVAAGGISPQDLLVLADAELIDANRVSIRWIKDDEPGEIPAAEKRMNQADGAWPGKHELRYPSGQVVTIKTPSSMYQVDAYLVPPRTRPFLQLVAAETNPQYLQALVKMLNSQPYFKATLQETVSQPDATNTRTETE